MSNPMLRRAEGVVYTFAPRSVPMRKNFFRIFQHHEAGSVALALRPRIRERSWLSHR
jgi:hypothetical protein